MTSVVDLLIRVRTEGLNQIGELGRQLDILQTSLAGGYKSQFFGIKAHSIKEQLWAMEQVHAVTNEERVALGGLMDVQQRATFSMEDWNMTNYEAHRIMQTGLFDYDEAIGLAEHMVEAKNAEAIATQVLAEIEDEERRARGRARQEMMQMSIGMFVLGITATQTTTVLADMVGKNSELGKTFMGIGGAIRMMLGPIQVYVGLLQLMNIENKKLLISSLPLMFTFGGIFLLFKAFAEQSKNVRAAMGALATGMLVMAAASKVMTAQQYAEGISSIFKWVTASGPLAPGMAALILTAAAAAIAGGLALYATAPKGQTIPGYMRPIRETGIFYGHRGEMVGRIGNMGAGGGNTTNININIERGAVVDDSVIRKMTREIEASIASGIGV